MDFETCKKFYTLLFLGLDSFICIWFFYIGNLNNGVCRLRDLMRNHSTLITPNHKIMKIGHLQLNEDENKDYHFIGVMKTSEGEKSIITYCGRNGKFDDYMNCYVDGHSFKAVVPRGKDYYVANVENKDGDLVELRIVKDYEGNIADKFIIELVENK